VLRAALEPLKARIDRAFVFGSVARGEHGPDSDIDVLVVGEVSFSEVVAALYESQQTLGREINPLGMRPHEYEARRHEPGFVARVNAGPTMALLGGGDDA